MANLSPLQPTVYVVRHAKVAVSGICYGRSEVAVEEPASVAAARVLQSVRALSLDIGSIHASPSLRTRELAECLATTLGCELAVDARLAELDFGEWEGRSWDTIYREDRDQFVHWARDPMHLEPPRGETAFALIQRISAWLRTIGTERVLAVTHAGPIRALRALRTQPQGHAGLCLDFAEEVPHLAIERI